jgi:predicted DNA-binding antitoxin AbrB/MazE fold protein
MVRLGRVRVTGHPVVGLCILLWAFASYSGAAAMTLTVEAIYENGVLIPVRPLPLKEREQVQVTVRKLTGLADRTYGMIGWSGDAAAFERLFNESEADRLEPA